MSVDNGTHDSSTDAVSELEEWNFTEGTTVGLTDEHQRKKYFVHLGDLIISVTCSQVSKADPEDVANELGNLHYETTRAEAFNFLHGDFSPVLWKICLGCDVYFRDDGPKPCDCPVEAVTGHIDWPAIPKERVPDDVEVELSGPPKFMHTTIVE